MNAIAGLEPDDDCGENATSTEFPSAPSTPGCEPAQGDERWLSMELSPTLIAGEYRAIDEALRPAAPIVESFDPTPYPAEALTRAGTFWLAMLRNEYESAAVFVDMAVQLRAINATIDVQTVALRMAQDELRHAAICGRVVEALGGTARIPAPPAPQPVAHESCSPEEGVLRTVIAACCLSEMASVVRLMKRHTATPDPFIRDAVRLLLADERLHAQFGFQYLESQRAWIAARPDVRRSLGSYLRGAFAGLEEHFGSVPLTARPLTDIERALGLPDLLDLSKSFQETMLNASIPGLERFGIDAMSAWRDRANG